MTKRRLTNIAASVHQRLLNKARQSGRPFNELLQYFAIERFMYRLSKTEHGKKFILKGALMLPVWGACATRPTKDIDLLGQVPNEVGVVVAVIKDACRQNVEPDGMIFDPDSVQGERIAEEADQEGVRARLTGCLGNARLSMQIDVGFGDVVSPAAKPIEYPTLLDMPAPRLRGYSRESTIAEKLHAMVKLDILNSRMRDFWDIWIVSQTFDFEGARLVTAVRKTFENRKTEIPAEPAVFRREFRTDQAKTAQWAAFLRRAKPAASPGSFADVVAALEDFLAPVLDSIAQDKPFRGRWRAPGPWQ